MNRQGEILDLLNKFDVPAPRYTSYPTVPYWEPTTLDADTWKAGLLETFRSENGEMCIYIHLPFCENLCTFCACNKRITKNHKVEDPYIEALIREWSMYLELLEAKPVIREIHLGGGTPTFFSPENLSKLIKAITGKAGIAPDHEFSVEVHPNYTTREHLAALADVGFNRISLGVQDFDPVVQLLINRVQTFEKTRDVVEWSRELGYSSVNIDIIYGLPKQTTNSVETTIAYIGELKPDRIAFYSYAHVPWKSKVQRRYTDEDLPKAEEKWQMYDLGRRLLMEQGFEAIGMDHFAMPEDKLFTALKAGRMHRNFMGYTTTDSKLLLGLGCSSIGDVWTAFAQNEKEVESYVERVNRGEFPIVSGHALNTEDLHVRKDILDLMCRAEAIIDLEVYADAWDDISSQLEFFREQGLIELQDNKLTLREKGRLFVRNICAAIDLRMRRKSPESNVFSKAI